MSPSLTPAQAETLAVIGTILRSMLDGLPVRPGATPEGIAAQQEAAMTAATDFMPCDAVQAMLAARIVAGFYALTDCFRRTALPDLPHVIAARYQGNIVRLSRMIDTTRRELRELQALQRKQAAPARPEAAAAPQAPARPAQPSKPQAQPAAAARIERQDPMQREPTTQPLRPVVMLPPGPPDPGDVWIAEEMARRRAEARAAGDKMRAA